MMEVLQVQITSKTKLRGLECCLLKYATCQLRKEEKLLCAAAIENEISF